MTDGIGGVLVAQHRTLDDPDVESFVGTVLPYEFNTHYEGWLVPGAPTELLRSMPGWDLTGAHETVTWGGIHVDSYADSNTAWKTYIYAQDDWIVIVRTDTPNEARGFFTGLDTTSGLATQAPRGTDTPAASEPPAWRVYLDWAHENVEYLRGDVEELQAAVAADETTIEVAATHWQVDGESIGEDAAARTPPRCGKKAHAAIAVAAESLRSNGARMIDAIYGTGSLGLRDAASEGDDLVSAAEDAVRRMRCP